MFKFLLPTIHKINPAIGKQIDNFILLSDQFGQKETIKINKAIDRDGQPIPWYTYSMIEYLNNFDFKKHTIFEFGCGCSSLYWANRCKHIVSVEHDEHWYNTILTQTLENQKLILARKKDDYINSLSLPNSKFDIIIIDGEWREICADVALKQLNKGGLIIFDNSDWYPNTTRHIREKGFFQIDFSGFGPINNYCWTTSIFIESENKMQLNYICPHPIGGLNNKND